MMNKTVPLQFSMLMGCLLCLLLSGCTEPYILQTNTFESALVIEATLTNELKNQEIKITRTFRFEETEPAIEAGAEVTVTDSDGNEFGFDEMGGKYVSTNAFQAEPGKTYKLTIVTQDGRAYSSSPETLTTVNPLQDVTATIATVEGRRGVAITAKSFDPANSSKYYRYEYEETYKIIAPNWSNFRAVLGPPIPPETHESIVTIPQGPETRTCYGTQNSIDIIQSTSTDLSEDRQDFVVRFVDEDDYIISHRYSILVKQYIQNLAAYNFYRTLKQISGSGGILSPTQPGFFYGNMKSVDNPNEKVIGFFEVASVSSKRIFFNYVDLFPGEELPPYYVPCDQTVFNYCFNPMDPTCNGALLIASVRYDSLLYFGGSNPYRFVPPPCADCTKFASNIVPPFWE